MNQENQEDLKKIEALTYELKGKLPPLENHVIWGHGTRNRATAEMIADEGIIVSSASGIKEIAVPLTGDIGDDVANVKTIVDEACSWKHRDRKQVVLLAIPYGFGQNDAVELITVDGKDKTRVPKRFVIGFIDAITGEFVANNDFTPNPKATNKPEAAIGKRKRAGGPLGTTVAQQRFTGSVSGDQVKILQVPLDESITEDDDFW